MIGLGLGVVDASLRSLLGPSLPAVDPIALSAASIAENAAPGTIIGTLSTATAGVTFSLDDDSEGRFALSGSNLVAGLVATDFEASNIHVVTVRATKAGLADRVDSFDISVTNIFEAPNLSALSLSASSFVTGTAASGTINGATAGSTITATGLPDGLTIDGAARTWAWSGAGAVRTATPTLIETLADSANSPRGSVIAYAFLTLRPLALLRLLLDIPHGMIWPMRQRSIRTLHALRWLRWAVQLAA
ncbi:MAG: cadherin repeat domain-containing protein [Parasphingorhabdus sp.]|nr:cadherin repeat domain-containing protein [Parasphingorhabdus sp.]